MARGRLSPTAPEPPPGLATLLPGSAGRFTPGSTGRLKGKAPIARVDLRLRILPQPRNNKVGMFMCSISILSSGAKNEGWPPETVRQKPAGEASCGGVSQRGDETRRVGASAPLRSDSLRSPSLRCADAPTRSPEGS